MSERLTMITGRRRGQAAGMHKGTDPPEYRDATARLEMNPDDMARLDIEAGGKALLRTAESEGMDGASVPLRRVISTGRGSDEEILDRIMEAVA